MFSLQRDIRTLRRLTVTTTATTTTTTTRATMSTAKESAISVYLEESKQLVIVINSMAGKGKNKRLVKIKKETTQTEAGSAVTQK